MLTKQSIFNKAVNGLLKQKKPAVNKLGECLFKTSGGLKCAIGFSIPEDKYKKSLEGEPAIHVLIKVGVVSDTLPLIQRESFSDFLDELQMAHDNTAYDLDRKFTSDFVKALKPELKKIARRFKLKMPSALKK